MTDFYTASGAPAYRSGPSGTSAAMRAEFTAIQTAMAKLAGYTGNGSKFLRVNAGGTAYEALTVADALAALAPNSAALAAAISDETGTGALVFATSPTLVTPLLGTPTSGVLTNCTGTAAGLTAGNVTTNANLTGHITSSGNAAVLGSFTSAQLATALTDETGSGAAVFATSPTLVTPNLGTPSACVATNLTGTASALNIGGSAASLAGARPKFGAHASGSQSLTSGVAAKVAFQTSDYDTNSNFDNVTNYRFTPTIAGYYFITWALQVSATSGTLTDSYSLLYKNGADVETKGHYQGPGINVWTPNGNSIIYMNGSSDYIEIFVIVIGTSPNISSGLTSVAARISGSLLI
jgi:hypothetical protein